MVSQINNILANMHPVTLDEMKHIRLMDRVDSKYVTSLHLLPELLQKMMPLFRVQEVDGERIASYSTQYLDTQELSLYVMHQNGKLNRQKIRIRSYLDSKLSFLEVKNKNNKGRTSKKRTPVALSHLNSIDDLGKEKSFLSDHSIFDIGELSPSLAADFQRITLVNNNSTERITIDLNISFQSYSTEIKSNLEDLVILELKQDGWKHSDFRDILNEMRIKRTSFSKYCMGTVLTNPNVKYNRFKKKCIVINKLVK